MWRKWNELTIKQRAQADVMFSADVNRATLRYTPLLALRMLYGYWLADDGNVTCRRHAEQIRNWQATSHLEG